MPDDIENLIRRLIGNDDRVKTEILVRARTDTSPTLLVAAALLTDGGSDLPAGELPAGDLPAGELPADDLLTRAAENATTTRDRQLVAIAAAHLDNDEDRLDAFVRDHLSEHPDNILVAWIAAKHPRNR